MTPPESPLSHTSFNPAAYTDAVSRLNAAIARPNITIDEAKDLQGLLSEQRINFSLSLSTPEFATTLQVLERLATVERRPANFDFVDAVPAFAQATLADIGEHIDRQPEVYTIPAYQVAHTFMKGQDPRLSYVGQRLLATNFERFLTSPHISDAQFKDVLTATIAVGDVEQIKQLVQLSTTTDSALLKRFPKEIDSILNIGLLGDNSYKRREKLVGILDEITGGLGSKMVNAWEESSPDGLMNNENFGFVCSLEKARPGIVKFLAQEYGILTFSRYPIDLLIEQFDTREEKGVPYGVMVVAKHDENGIIYDQRDEFRHAYEQAKASGTRLKIYEAEKADDIIDDVEKAFARHGQLSYMFVLAHGGDNMFALSLADDGVTSESLRKLASMRHAFTDTAMIAFLSCTLGVSGGFAQELSSIIPNIDIHAADMPVRIQEHGIHIFVSNGTLSARVHFEYAEGNFNTILDDLFEGSTGLPTRRTEVINQYPVPTLIYRNGVPHGEYA